MPKLRPTDSKEEALRSQGALNTHVVRDELFARGAFFDPRDVVQVKYEMLRKVEQEGASVTEAAAGFGFSRLSFYKLREAFVREGIGGLLPRKRGPRGGHKLTGEVVSFVEELRAQGEPMGMEALLERIEERFGVRVHRRSLERALGRRGKKTP
jgi:transposase